MYQLSVYADTTFLDKPFTERTIRKIVDVDFLGEFTLAEKIHLASLADAIQFPQLKRVKPLCGDRMELGSVATTLIGGTHLSEGNGKITGAVVGALLLGTLKQGLVLMGIPLQVFRATSSPFIIMSFILSNYIQGDV